MTFFTRIFQNQLFTFLLSLVTTVVAAQEVSINITFQNEKKEPVPLATVTIFNRSDSTRTFTKLTDSNGVAQFTLRKNNQYNVNISAINYQSVDKGISISGDQITFNFLAEAVGKTLETAVVTSKKPLMKMEDDKLIVDPENLIEASTSGYEVIEKTPGLVC